MERLEGSIVNDVFSEYVRSLAAGGEPDQSSYDEVREHLRALLVTELRRRGLWEAPPSYLGVTAPSWRDPGALEELVAGAYVYSFADRLRGLTNQLAIRDNIHGLIVRNVRNFLTHRQRKADPIGYRVFVRLRKAVEGLIEKGRLLVRGWTARETPAINNLSTLSFGPFPTPVADRETLEPPVRRWNDELMPELVTAEGPGVPKVIEELGEHVSTLPEDGVQAFRLGHLAGVLKRDARGRWLSVWRNTEERMPVDGEPGAEQVPVALPDPEPDGSRFREVVLDCVESAIGAVRQAKLQRDLWTVWLFLRSTRVDTEDASAMPSYSEIGRQLGLNRERVSQLFDKLKQWTRRCFQCDGLCATTTNDDAAGRQDQQVR